MEQLVIKQFKLLPEYLQVEVLHYIQYLLQVKYPAAAISKPKKAVKLNFSDFHFPERKQTYSRSEIYGDDGR